MSVEIAGETEADRGAPRADVAGPTRRETRVPGILQPGAAAGDPLAAIAILPGGPVGRGALVGLVPAIAGPFPDIAKRVVEAEGVRREGADRRRRDETIVARHRLVDRVLLVAAGIHRVEDLAA